MREKLVARLRQIALAPTGIRSKLLLAFLLMSAVPLVMLCLVAGWFAFPPVREFYQLERWFPILTTPTEATWWLLGLLVLTVMISLLGSIYLAIKIIEPVIHISHEAKQLAGGEYDRELSLGLGDELGDLTWALNQLTSRIRDNMGELKRFGERSSQINLEIHKRMVILSGLLQIGELVTSGGELNVVLDLVVEKLALLEGQAFSFLCLQPIEGLPITLHRANGIDVSEVQPVAFHPSQALIDEHHPAAATMRPAWERLGRPNLLVQPVSVRKRLIGVLGVGNRDPHARWSQEVVDLATIFAKQTSIALENELLLRKTKALAIHDELTGAYTETYIRERLAEEIKRAILYQRPCALAMFFVQDLVEFRRRRGDPEAERVLKNITRLIQESVSEIDRVGRFNGNAIAVLLPERNKRQASEVMEAIRQRAASAFEAAPDPQDRLTLVGSVAENPLDGATAEELIDKASSVIQPIALVGQNPAR